MGGKKVAVLFFFNKDCLEFTWLGLLLSKCLADGPALTHVWEKYSYVHNSLSIIYSTEEKKSMLKSLLRCHSVLIKEFT